MIMIFSELSRFETKIQWKKLNYLALKRKFREKKLNYLAFIKSDEYDREMINLFKIDIAATTTATTTTFLSQQLLYYYTCDKCTDPY